MKTYVVQLLVEANDVLDAIQHMESGKVEAILPYQKDQCEEGPVADAIGYKYIPVEDE